MSSAQSSRLAMDGRAQAAIDDYDSGIYSVPVAACDKMPIRKAWQKLRLARAELLQVFNETVNRGRLLGVPPPPGQHGGPVVCVDLDTPEAVALASSMLPPSGEIGGRESEPASHWFYQCDPPPKTKRFNAPDGTRLLELLSTGTQVVVPPSVHPCGEAYIWKSSRPRATVHGDMLVGASERLAAATLLLQP